MPGKPDLTVIVPVHNGGEYLERCLDALTESSHPSFEIIVVDDCSTDETVKTAEKKGVAVLKLHERSGPASARNFGVRHARGEIILFIDSDVVVRGDTVARIAEGFRNHPDVAAIFGSYDDEPADGGFISQYRNLFHHYHHQNADTEAFSFWAGCGAVRKKIFEEAGGFNHTRYPKPSIEDIELGHRIRKRGHRIILDKDLVVKHLKGWRFLAVLHTDIFRRAIPWSRLIMETGSMPKDLNLKLSQKISSISVALMVVSLPLLASGNAELHGIPVTAAAGLFISVLLIIFLLLNRRLYGFYRRTRGVGFMLKAFPLHVLYYLYSGMSFVFCWITFKFSFLKPLYRIVGEQDAGVHRKN